MWEHADVIEVRDPADERVDDFRALTTADRRPDRPGGKGLVIAEGVLVVRRMLASRFPLRAILGVPRRIDELGGFVDGGLHGLAAPVYVTSADVMAEVVGFHLNRGVLAVADRPPALSVDDVVGGVAGGEHGGEHGGARRLAVLEGVGDHENLGALFRNAAALGVDGVLLGPGCSDPLYRRSVRVSMGHVLGVPFASLRPWPAGLKLLRDRGFRVLAMTPSPDAAPLAPVAGRVAVLLGSEGPGLSAEAVAAADTAVRIPMAGGVDSLNVATAGAVAFYALAASGR